MISIYSSAFNLIKNRFNIKFHIDNFCHFADEVVVAVNTSVDNTLEFLLEASKTYKNLKIIPVKISYSDPLLDGKIKNIALQSTSMPCKVGLDMDEFIPIEQKNIWYNLASILLGEKHMSCMIPSVNLYKNLDCFFSITPKWYLHKSGLFRGPVNYAYKSNGHIDTNKSDTCELIDQNGNLVPSLITPCDINDLRSGNYPFVIHTGYLSFEDRLLRNNEFWREHWLIESGGQKPNHKIHECIEDFAEPYEPHMLNIGAYQQQSN